MNGKTAFYTHPDCELHEMGAGHPESPARLRAIREYLAASGLLAELDCRDAPLVERSALARVHPESYLDALDEASPQEGRVRLDPDTALNPHSLRAAQRAAGAVVDAVSAVIGGALRNAFCAVRPPGHHAERAQAMGFCFYNNVAVGAHAALAAGLERVAIVDFDVHHGNGTVDIFKDEPRVLVCSSFQHPFYPYRYHDTVRPNIVNTPLAAGSGGAEFRRSIESRWLPALEAHRPGMLFVSAGFDAHRHDPLGGLELDETDYTWVTQLICELARRFADDRVVSVLEGGYDLNALARSVAAHVQVLRETSTSASAASSS